MQPPSSAEWTAKVASWNREKGYGFLQFGDKRVFLHRRDLVGVHRTPAVGDKVRFLIGHDDQSRACARKAVCLRGGLGVSFFSLVLLGLLLILPAIALHRLMPEVSPLGTGTYVLVASFMTYGAYASDKRRAQTGQWRTSEATLHLFELLGGWPWCLGGAEASATQVSEVELSAHVRGDHYCVAVRRVRLAPEREVHPQSSRMD